MIQIFSSNMGQHNAQSRQKIATLATPSLYTAPLTDTVKLQK
jgi:hypothetical protein